MVYCYASTHSTYIASLHIVSLTLCRMLVLAVSRSLVVGESVCCVCSLAVMCQHYQYTIAIIIIVSDYPRSPDSSSAAHRPVSAASLANCLAFHCHDPCKIIHSFTHTPNAESREVRRTFPNAYAYVL